jgi:SMC interacting uncharacterized protein involved in chromosome segregation
MFRSKKKYYSKLAEKMARAEKRAMRKFEKKFLQYQLLKKNQVGKLEMEIQEVNLHLSSIICFLDNLAF